MTERSNNCQPYAHEGEQVSIRKYRPTSRALSTCYLSQEHGSKTHENRSDTDPEACTTIAKGLGWRPVAISLRAGPTWRARRAAGGGATWCRRWRPTL